MVDKSRRPADVRHRSKQLKRIYLRDNAICQLCGEFCAVVDASREHVVRLADGGSKDDSNVVLSHKRCNQLADIFPLRPTRLHFAKSRLPKTYNNQNLQQQPKSISEEPKPINEVSDGIRHSKISPKKNFKPKNQNLKKKGCKMEISPALMERVDAGVAWVNENLPDWREHVDPRTIDMGDASKCFLGQYYSSMYGYPDVILPFYRALVEYFGGSWDRTQELGFSSDSSFYTELTVAWRQKFIELGLLDESES